MWGSSWTMWTGVIAIVAVLLGALFTAWTPIFGIVIVIALVPIAGFFLVARRRGEEAGPSPESRWADAPDEVGPEHDVRVEDGMVSDRRRARPS
jgi:hypothetical protein